MSTVIHPGAPAGAAAASGPATPRRTRPASRWRQRWYRMVIPFAVVGMLIGITLVVRALEEPDLGDPATLSPISSAPDGSQELAEQLRQQGVTVTHVTDPEVAIQLIESAPEAVLFVAKPSLVSAALAGAADRNPGIRRVVMVAPNQLQLLAAGVAAHQQGGKRWATGVADPRCEVPEAVAAGRAAAVRQRYFTSPEEGGEVCYGGGLVRLAPTEADPEVFVIGAAQPFTNRRLAEYGNRELALGLLGGHQQVIWLDALPMPDFNLELPQLKPPSRSEMDREGGGNPLSVLLTGYPPGVVVGLTLALLLAVLVAMARARRLGPPVREPLPVVVPSTEVVSGRGRLYQLTHARPAALAALRTAALRRIIRALDLPPAPPPTPEEVVAAAAERTGWPPEHLWQVLYGPAPDTDDQLIAAVAALDQLVELITRDNPAAKGGAS